jgi:hypothetical protein
MIPGFVEFGLLSFGDKLMSPHSIPFGYGAKAGAGGVNV